MTLYNDIDDGAAAWLRELAARGHITPGDVDTRSIAELIRADLENHTQVHLFAGIGGWSYAMRLAGWPDDRPVWTASCPCQPFSIAGKRKGQADERHLWPECARLIGECRPPVVFGEQVAAAIGTGWLDGVFADLEGLGYACGAAVLGAHSVGAPHIRQRLWWFAYLPSGLPNAAHADGWSGEQAEQGRQGIGRGGPANRGPWDNYIVVPCDDGKARRLEPSISPLVDGVPARVVRLRGYGNAIVPQVAAAWIEACMSEIERSKP